ncbi:hypothetical protein A9Q89_00210 [Gammaproteobacteria bacterium 53_120_T64]|nr:hypothetical protein A9Q89_00210 [Gammaproteobacteria bacterium 53_120_T64]
MAAHLLVIGLFSLPAISADTISLPPGKTMAATCDGPLNILLSNDDGFNQPGILALKQALGHAQHRVVIAAPAKNASGSSASISFAPVKVERVEADVYAVSASPATAVVLAVSALHPTASPPDLIISGINKGANLGPATGISGTVGATTAAIEIIDPPIPAIAISTDPLGPDYSAQENTEHLQRISSFIAKLVEQLKQQQCKNGLLLPQGLALNINYPALPRNKIKGIAMKEQGQAPYFTISYQPSTEHKNIFLPLVKTQAIRHDNTQSDTLAYHQGYITIVPINGNYTSKSPAIKALIEPIILKLIP